MQPLQKKNEYKTQLINGVLLLDKSPGLSSHQALNQVKYTLNAKKAGHTGTLDPFATGLLPLCFGQSTKFTQVLLNADKTYHAVVHLGVTTTTGDTEGEILHERPINITLADIQRILPQFQGHITQMPPMYSALKYRGKPLYDYARAGITIERTPRHVIIHQLDLIAYEPPYLSLQVRCSKGTYIRVLGEDIGSALGCGGHLYALRRTQIASITLAQAITFRQWQAIPESERLFQLAPVDYLLSTFPQITLTAALTQRFLQGQKLNMAKEDIIFPIRHLLSEGRVRVYGEYGRFLGTARVDEDQGVVLPERLVFHP